MAQFFTLTNVTIPEVDALIYGLNQRIDAAEAANADLLQRVTDLQEQVKHIDTKVIITTEDLETLERKYNAQPFTPSGIDEFVDRKAELAEKPMENLRALAIKYGYDVDEVNAAERDVLVDTIYEEELQQRADAEKALEGSERAVEPLSDAGAKEVPPEHPLEGMSLKGLREVAEERGLVADEYRSLSQQELLYLLQGGSDNEFDETFTKEDLEAKTVVGLRAIAKALGINTTGVNKADLVDLILQAE